MTNDKSKPIIDPQSEGRDLFIRVLQDHGIKIVNTPHNVDPKEILSKIEKGDPVEYDQVFVDGYLDLSILNLRQRKISRSNEDLQTLGLSENKKIVKSKIKITNSKIKWIKCNDVIFIDSIDFEGTEFEEPADFSGTVFCCSTSFIKTIFFHSYFQGAKFCKDVLFRGAEFKTHADFRKVVSCQSIDFSNTRFGTKPNFQSHIDFSGKTEFLGDATFNNAIINGFADFKEVRFKNAANFIGTIFLNEANFDKSVFDKYTGFLSARFWKAAHFVGTIFLYNVTFMDAQFERGADFGNATFQGIVSFMDTQFKGESLNFKGAAFGRAKDQEAACVKAKKIFDNQGRKKEADYHFFREMVARRKQKPWFIRYLEYISIQLIIGYGVHPERLAIGWSIIVIAFAIFYGAGNAINGATQPFDYLKVSFAIAIAPGYIAAIITPGSTGYNLLPEYQAGAMIETLIGTFIWAGFIATFAKKYMK